MLVRALTDEFKHYFDRAGYHDTVLWFDADGEYAALLEHLAEVPPDLRRGLRPPCGRASIPL